MQWREPSSPASHSDQLWGIMYLPELPCGVRLSLQLGLKFCPGFSSFPSLPCSSQPLTGFFGTASRTYRLDMNPHLRVCFWRTRPNTFGKEWSDLIWSILTDDKSYSDRLINKPIPAFFKKPPHSTVLTVQGQGLLLKPEGAEWLGNTRTSEIDQLREKEKLEQSGLRKWQYRDWPPRGDNQQSKSGDLNQVANKGSIIYLPGKYSESIGNSIKVHWL